MTGRIIDISHEGYYLKLRQNQLILRKKDEDAASLPIEDLSAVILDNPQSAITQVCLSYLAEQNVMVIVSDRQHQPVGLMLPLQSNTLQGERFSQQAEASQPLKKQLWKQVVQSKLRIQSRVLTNLTGSDRGIATLIKKIRSGDPGNIEAQAARRYWRQLFGNKQFRRDRDSEDQNRYLNYVYAILRALMARSICATGLHPCLGIHHHNRYNAFALADDLMEPYRPYGDLRTWQVVQDHGVEESLSKSLKMKLLEVVKQPVQIGSETYTLQGAMQRTAQSLRSAFAGEIRQLALPND